MRIWQAILLPCAILFCAPAMGALSGITASDVTPVSIGLVAQSTEIVTSVSIDVYTDPDGLTPVPAAKITIASEGIPGAQQNGIVRATVDGLAPNTTFYLRISVDGPSGVATFPVAAPFFGITTADISGSLAAAGQLAVNELITFAPYVPNAVTTAGSMLVLLRSPLVMPGPISAFVEPAAPVPGVYFDLNNALTSSGTRASILPGSLLELTEIRGNACPDTNSTRFRRAPSTTPLGSPLAFAALNLCQPEDVLCDDTINVLDFQHALNSFNSVLGDCEFNPDIDLIPDGQVNDLDLQQISTRYGEDAPFN